LPNRVRISCRWLFSGWVLAVALATTSWAASVQGLYEAEVPLENDTQAQRAAAFSEAMGQVLTRVTGRPEAATMEETADLRRAAERYVQQYRVKADGNLWVAFDSFALDAALADRGLPIWGAERPAVLLVLAVDQGGGARFVLSAEDEVPDPSAQELRDRMTALADDRGLPLILPLMDAQDRSVISFGEVWGGFDTALQTAGDRYRTDAVLLGRLSADAEFRTRWTLYSGDQAYRWTGGLEDGINGTSDRFAQRYAVTTGAAVEGEIGLAVHGVSSLEDYGRVLAYLEGLTAVRSVQVRALRGDTVVFGLELIGSIENVDRAIRLGSLLGSDETGAPNASAPDLPGMRRVLLSYRLSSP
jgi:hypothetical protein